MGLCVGEQALDSLGDVADSAAGFLDAGDSHDPPDIDLDVGEVTEGLNLWA